MFFKTETGQLIQNIGDNSGETALKFCATRITKTVKKLVQILYFTR